MSIHTPLGLPPSPPSPKRVGEGGVDPVVDPHAHPSRVRGGWVQARVATGRRMSRESFPRRLAGGGARAQARKSPPGLATPPRTLAFTTHRRHPTPLVRNPPGPPPFFWLLVCPPPHPPLRPPSPRVGFGWRGNYHRHPVQRWGWGRGGWDSLGDWVRGSLGAHGDGPHYMASVREQRRAGNGRRDGRGYHRGRGSPSASSDEGSQPPPWIRARLRGGGRWWWVGYLPPSPPPPPHPAAPFINQSPSHDLKSGERTR